MTRILALTLASLLAALILPAAADEYSAKVWAADAAAGATVYASSCVACHGVAGNSLVPAQPILAAQHPEYLVNQMFQFRAKTRVNALMLPFMQLLSDADIYNLAAYLGTQSAGLSGASDQTLAATGELIYRNGLAAQNVPNCSGCHGPNGLGIPPEFPRLSGQHKDYLVITLKELRTGVRVNHIMNEVATGLSDADIEAVAEYISGLY